MSQQLTEVDVIEEMERRAYRSQKEQDAANAVSNARTKLVLGKDAKSAFFAVLALGLETMPNWDIDTFAVDGKRLMYNPDFAIALKPEERIGVVCHEVMHCFPAGTLIPGADRPIEEIGVGDTVVDAGGEFTSVVNTMSRKYDGDLVVIKPRGMLPLRVTDEHPILVRTYKWKFVAGPRRTNVRDWSDPVWKKAAEVQEGDWVHVPMAYGPYSPTHITDHDGLALDEETAEFLGWYVAEGYTSRQGDYHNIGLCLGPREYPEAQHLADVIRKRMGCSAKVHTRGGGTGYLVRASGAPLGRWLLHHCGAGARNKRIPAAILYHKDLRILAAFLHGYISGDGHATRTVSFGTASRLLALQVQLAFARLGVLINLHYRGPQRGVIRGRGFQSHGLYHGYTTARAAFELLGFHELAHPARQTQYFGRAGECLLTPVVAVSRERFTGEVFNLETKSHTYVAQNVVTHNCAQKFWDRMGDRDPVIFNIAADLAINHILKESSFALPAGGCFPGEGKFKRMPPGLSTEEYYRLLQQDLAKAKSPTQAFIDEAKSGMDPGGCGQVLRPGDGTKQAANQASLDWDQRVAAAAQAAKYRGTLPAGIQGLVAQIGQSKVDWREVLRQFVSRVSSNDFSWHKPNRRFLHQGLILPGMRSDELGDIVLVVDASGSCFCKETQDAFASEMQGILDSFHVKVHIIYHDCQVYEPIVEWESSDGPLVLTPQGGGGTSHIPAFELIEQKDIKPTCVVCLTDCFSSFPDQEPDYPVLWAVVGNPKPQVPWGQVVLLED